MSYVGNEGLLGNSSAALMRYLTDYLLYMVASFHIS